MILICCFSKKRFSTCQEAPESAKIASLIHDPFDLFQCEFLACGFSVRSGKVDKTVTAIVVAAVGEVDVSVQRQTADFF
jgi:hypothetical protein